MTDPLSAPRGILTGLLLSILLWAAIGWLLLRALMGAGA